MPDIKFPTSRAPWFLASKRKFLVVSSLAFGIPCSVVICLLMYGLLKSVGFALFTGAVSLLVSPLWGLGMYPILMGMLDKSVERSKNY
jgi:hypothetical protein